MRPSASRLTAFLVCIVLCAAPLSAQDDPKSPRSYTHYNQKRDYGPKGSVSEHVLDDHAYGRKRTVWVYRPAGYDESSATRYGMLVLFDGGSQLETVSITLDNLIASKVIAPVVGVFVDNGSNRLRADDLTNHAKFAEFIAGELVPWARTNWRVDSDPRRTIVGGYSLGGLAASYVAFRHPEIFGNVISQSGAFWHGEEGNDRRPEWLTQQFRTAEKLPLRFYLEVGTAETNRGPDGSCFLDTTRRMRDVLRKKGYDVGYAEIAGAGHDAGHWIAAFPDALVYLAEPGSNAPR